MPIASCLRISAVSRYGALPSRFSWRRAAKSLTSR